MPQRNNNMNGAAGLTEKRRRWKPTPEAKAALENTFAASIMPGTATVVQLGLSLGLAPRQVSPPAARAAPASMHDSASPLNPAPSPAPPLRHWFPHLLIIRLTTAPLVPPFD
jgi:hypothetical protein